MPLTKIRMLNAQDFTLTHFIFQSYSFHFCENIKQFKICVCQSSELDYNLKLYGINT